MFKSRNVYAAESDVFVSLYAIIGVASGEVRVDLEEARLSYVHTHIYHIYIYKYIIIYIIY